GFADRHDVNGWGKRKAWEGLAEPAGQLLMMTTIAPTRAIRTNNNSLSPKRLNTVRTSDLLLIMPLNQRGKADARMIMSDFQPFWVRRGGRIERFRTGRTVRISIQ